MQAKSNVKALETNKKYSYDLNKDGKKETLYFYKDNGIENYEDKKIIDFYINEKKYSITTYYKSYSTYLITLANGKRIINISTTIENGYQNYNFLLSYSSGEPVIMKLFKVQWGSQLPVKVKGNVIYYHTSTQTPRTGRISFFTKFKVVGNTVKQIKTTEVPQSTSKKTWTAIIKFKAYTKMSGKKVAFTMNKGDKIKITNINATSKLIYAKIKRKDNGKSGWIKIDYKNSWQDGITPYFKECSFAG